MSYKYKTIVSESTGMYKEKGSKFLSFAIPVHSIEQVKDTILQHKSKYYDARHVCYAYMLGCDRDQFRANDDGEPSGTAGKPILGQLNSTNLTNVLIIVVRYFGGVLLGTGGLIVAYREAAADAIKNAVIIEKDVELMLELSFSFETLNEVMSLCKQQNIEIIEQCYDNNCSMVIQITKTSENIVLNRLSKIQDLKFEPKLL